MRDRKLWAQEFIDLHPDQKREWAEDNLDPMKVLFPGLAQAPSASEDMQSSRDPLLDAVEILEEELEEQIPAGLQNSRQAVSIDIGDEVWPVSRENFVEHLSSLAEEFSLPEWRGGICRVAEKAREQLRSGMTISGNSDLQPVLNVRLPCHEVHPGLCRQRDAATFRSAKDLAKSIHHLLKDVRAGDFVGFHTYQYSDVFCVGTRRLASPPLAVFASCRLHVSGDVTRLEILVNRGEFDFQTSYAIARRCCLRAEEGDLELLVCMGP